MITGIINEGNNRMSQKVPPEIAEKIVSLKGQYYSKGSIVRAIKKQAGSKEKALEYIEIVTNEVKKEEAERPILINDKANSELLIGAGAFFTGIVLAILGPLGFALTLFGVIYFFIGLFHKIEYKKRK